MIAEGHLPGRRCVSRCHPRRPAHGADLGRRPGARGQCRRRAQGLAGREAGHEPPLRAPAKQGRAMVPALRSFPRVVARAKVDEKRSEEHTSELQSRRDLVCRLLLEKKKKKNIPPSTRQQTQTYTVT